MNYWQSLRAMAIVLLTFAVKLLAAQPDTFAEILIADLVGALGIWGGLKVWFVSIDRESRHC